MIKHKPTIALLMNAFWNNGAGLSGGDQRLIQIFDCLSGDYKIDVYTSADGRVAIGSKIAGAKIFQSPIGLNRGNLILAYARRQRWATAMINKKSYDLVYGSSDFLPDVWPCYKYKKKHPGTKWIQCVFHYYPNWRTRPGNKLSNLIASRAQKKSFELIKELVDRVININFQVKDDLERDGFKKDKIAVNPCGIEIEYLSRLRAGKVPLTGSFIARLNPSKGIFDLPRVWRLVTDEVPSAKLNIIGGGSDKMRARLYDEIKKLELEKNINLLGFLSNDEAFKIIKSSEVFVFPSHEEGFGMAIAEALACSVPAVAWDLPVYSEVFPKGLITVREGDITEMSRRILELFKNRQRAKRIVSGGRSFIRRYGWPSIAQAENKILKSVLEK